MDKERWAAGMPGPVVTPPRDQPGDRRYLKPEMIDEEFASHAPGDETVGHVHTLVRAELRRLAHWLNDLLPEGPRKTDAINRLREAMWAANSAVAVYQSPEWSAQARQHVHFYDGKVVAFFEAEQRELAKLGQWFLRSGSDLIQEGSAVDNAIRLLGAMQAATAGAEAQQITRAVIDPGEYASTITSERAAEIVFEALGQAALAWDQIPNVYQTEVAAAVGRDLLFRLGFKGLPDSYLGTGGRAAILAAMDAQRPAELPGDVLYEITQTAYNAYGDAAGWVNYRKEPMPQWGALGDQIQRNWLAAVARAINAHEATTQLGLPEVQIRRQSGWPMLGVGFGPVVADPSTGRSEADLRPEPPFEQLPACGATTSAGPCVLAAGHPVGSGFPGEDGHMPERFLKAMEPLVARPDDPAE